MRAAGLDVSGAVSQDFSVTGAKDRQFVPLILTPAVSLVAGG